MLRQLKLFLATAALYLVGTGAMAETLSLVTEDAPPGTSFINGDGQVTGFAAEIVREALKRAGIDSSMAIHPWPRAYHMALTLRDTCVFATVRSAEREALFKWVGPIAMDRWTIYGRSDSPQLTDIAELRGHPVGGYFGDAATNYLKDLGVVVDEVADNRTNPRRLAARRIDYWVNGSLSANRIAQDAGAVEIVPLLQIKEVPLALACNRSVSDRTIQKMNASLHTLIEDGTANAVLKRFAD